MALYRVLVVDDSAFMRKIICDMISADKQFEIVATASNGQEAFDAAALFKPDVITMDLEMPQMNGLEALVHIMKRYPTPTIMMSSTSDDGTRMTIKALQFGAFDFIRKPAGPASPDIQTVGEQLLEKMRIAVLTRRQTPPSAPADSKPVAGEPAVPAAAEAAPKREPVRRIEFIDIPIEEAEQALKKPADEHAKAKHSADQDEPKPFMERLQQQPVHRPVAPPVEGVHPAPQVNTSNPEIQAPPKRADLPSKSGSIGKMEPNAARLSAKSSVKPKPETKWESKLNPEPKPAAPVKPAPIAADLFDEPVVTRAKQTNKTSSFRHLVAIGTSTGGPRALHEVITALPENLPAPVLVVQHMPPKFTHSLAQRLDSFSALQVTEATQGERVYAGVVYIAPGGYHMELAKDSQGYYLRLTEQPPRGGHRPSVDVMFESCMPFTELARHSVIMTGMGSDGAKGMKALMESGGKTSIAESEETCVVYGMPRSAVENGAAKTIVPLGRIASAIVEAVMK